MNGFLIGIGCFMIGACFGIVIMALVTSRDDEDSIYQSGYKAGYEDGRMTHDTW